MALGTLAVVRLIGAFHLLSLSYSKSSLESIYQGRDLSIMFSCLSGETAYLQHIEAIRGTLSEGIGEERMVSSSLSRYSIFAKPNELLCNQTRRLDPPDDGIFSKSCEANLVKRSPLFLSI